MIFHGLQKLTLLDYPGKVACTLFTAGCNFRCPFCHNASLVLRTEETETYTEEDVLAFLRKRAGVLDGVAVTGGEPLLHEEIVPFLEKVRALGYAIKLDTNGSRPALLKALVERGLVDYVAIDLKNSKAEYARTVGLASLDLAPIEESVAFLRSGAVPNEFRTTVSKPFHTAESLREAAEWIRGCERYFLQNFVDSGDLIEKGVSGFSKEEMQAFADVVRPIVPNVALRGI